MAFSRRFPAFTAPVAIVVLLGAPTALLAHPAQRVNPVDRIALVRHRYFVRPSQAERSVVGRKPHSGCARECARWRRTMESSASRSVRRHPRPTLRIVSTDRGRRSTRKRDRARNRRRRISSTSVNRGFAASRLQVSPTCISIRWSRASSGRRWDGRSKTIAGTTLLSAGMLSASSADSRCASAIDSQYSRETEH